MSAEHLRASDADRDQVATVLQTAYAEGRITADEHDERLDAALTAKTFGELAHLTADLVPQPVERSLAQRSGTQIANQIDTGEPDRLNAYLSTTKREGPWRVRSRSVSNNLMGSVKLDFTRASFDASVVELSTTNLMGSLVLRVPEGVTIRDETTNVMGSTSIKDIGEPDPRMPTIVITGTNIMGEIKVRGPKKPSRWSKGHG